MSEEKHVFMITMETGEQKPITFGFKNEEDIKEFMNDFVGKDHILVEDEDDGKLTFINLSNIAMVEHLGTTEEFSENLSDMMGKLNELMDNNPFGFPGNPFEDEEDFPFGGGM